MKRNTIVPVYTVLSLIILGHHTPTNAFLKGFSFFKKGSEQVVSLNEMVEPNCKVSISNIKGDITIKTWKTNKVVIEAHKKGSEKSLYDTDIKKTFAKNHLSIETVFKASDTKCNVHYHILVPETARLQAVKTEKGKITISNIQNGIMAKTGRGAIVMNDVSGPVKTSTTSGEISIKAKNIIPESKILAMSGKGTITLSFPKKTNSHIHLVTSKGQVKSDHTITTESRSMKYNSKTLAQLKKEAKGTIGSGGNSSIKLHTGSGNIVLVQS